MAPSGIEPATFWFIAQYLNHCATAVPHNIIVILIKLCASVGLNCNKGQGDRGTISSFKFADRIQNVLENNMKLKLFSCWRTAKYNAQAHVQFFWFTAYLSGPGAFRPSCFVSATALPWDEILAYCCNTHSWVGNWRSSQVSIQVVCELVQLWYHWTYLTKTPGHTAQNLKFPRNRVWENVS
jgi:hypothetical protein